MGYGDLKKGLFEQYWNHFAEFRARRAELAARPDHVKEVLDDGARRARAVAQATLLRAKAACGLG
jgi:tryptophanyl-tRNA synthetase